MAERDDDVLRVIRPQDGPAATPADVEDAEFGDGVRFYYDFATPDSYLAIERLVHTLGVVPELIPVRRRDLADPATLHPAPGDVAARSAMSDVVAGRHLQPLRWPAAWPFDDELALRAATYARGIGKVAAFSLAALRQAYAGGADLGAEQTVLLAAAACEIHPRALLVGVGTRNVAAALDRAGETARADGVRDLPSVVVGDAVFVGDAGLDAAAAAIDASVA
ncbi:DsbA family protein [Paraconexibacter algicola]|uniref:DsbA family protein n=1 Tax=Paraconexibacter algicola TaxID=2133960 RepID=UPI001304DFBB|nr:DsbA family protein [Paraconexibacter algicola]